MRGYLAICLTVAIAVIPGSGRAQSQYLFKTPAPVPTIAEPRENTLELAPAYGPTLPPAPPPLKHVEIPSPFIGCWEGEPQRFDSVVNSAGVVMIGKPGRIVFCYRPTHIDVPVAKLRLGPGDWVKNFAVHLGLGLAIPHVDVAGITTKIYAVTPTQIHARTFIPIKGVELILWLIPMPLHYALIDEEIATVKGSDKITVNARQELAAGRRQSLRYWHADFHRIVGPAPTE